MLESDNQHISYSRNNFKEIIQSAPVKYATQNSLNIRDKCIKNCFAQVVSGYSSVEYTRLINNMVDASDYKYIF